MSEKSIDPAEPMRQWIAHRVPSRAQQRLIDERLAAFTPLAIEIIVLDLADDAAGLKRTLASIQAARLRYPAIQPLVLRDIGHVNLMLGQSEAAWVILAWAGDELLSGGLSVTTLELLQDPGCRAIFCDELLRQSNGDLSAGLRPDFNLDYLLSFPVAMEKHWLVRREVLLEAGGYDANFGPAVEFELILRLISQGGMAGLGHIHEPLFSSPSPLLVESPAHRLALEQHLLLRGYDHASVHSRLPGIYQIDYGHQWQPLVSIVIVMRDELAATQRCVTSILEHTTYASFELVICANGSQSAEARGWLQGMSTLAPERIRVVRIDKPLDHSSACNQALAHAHGEYLLWLSPLAAVVEGQWLAQMLNHALRQEVGIVGAKTVDAEGRVTHAGLLLGLNGVAAPVFAGEPQDAPGYLYRLQTDQNYSAVSGICLMIRRSVFEELDGFDSDAFPDSGSDVDLCLRAGARGHLTVWTPRATLLHSAGPVPLSEVATQAAYGRWLAVLASDPAYNLNFTLNDPKAFNLTTSQLSWRPLSWRPLPVVIAFAADVYGAGHYRILQPFDALKEAGMIQGGIVALPPEAPDLARYLPDSIILQRPIVEKFFPRQRDMKTFFNMFKVFELDDYLPNLPVKSVHKVNFGGDTLRKIRRSLDFVDRFVVSTQPLADAFKGMHADIRVVPNRLDPAVWGRLPPSRRRAGQKPRVGWAGGVGHDGDLALITDLVKALAGEVEWVFLGGVPEVLQSYATYFNAGVSFSQYPAAVAALNLDLALAPLEKNTFNECKSNLRLLEYGICGYPVVCSDVAPYQDLPVTRVRDRYKDWLDAVRTHLADLDAAASMGDELREVIRRDWMLDERGLADWRAAWVG